jgi:sugar diacid utilization regulator
LSTDVRDQEIADGIVVGLLEVHEQIAERMMEAINAEVTEYQGAADPELVLADAREHCDAQIRSCLIGMRDRIAPADLDLSYIEETIARRVNQGIPLVSVLHSFRVGHRILWNAAFEFADRVDGGRAAAILLVQPMIQYIHTASTMVADAYLRESQTAFADADRVRRDVLEALIAEEPRAIAAAQSAGIDLDPQEPHHLLIALVGDGGEDDPSALPRLAEQAKETFGSPALLVVVRHQAVTILLRGDTRAIARSAEQLVAELAVLPLVGISLPNRLGTLGAAHEQASSALRLASPAQPVVALGLLSVLDYLISGADRTAQLLVPEKVRALTESDKASDADLLDTFNHYLRCGLNVQRTAATLPAHPNTVHGRLRRLSELTGYDLRDMDDVSRLAAELRLADVPNKGWGR